MEVGGVTVSEYRLWTGFARELARSFKAGANGVEATVVRRPNRRPDEALGDAIEKAKVDVAVELHFNAVANADVSGTLMIYRDGHAPSKALAEQYQKRTRSVLGLRDRGTVPRADLGIMRHTPDDLPLILTEPAFGSRPEDAATLLNELPDLMQAYREATHAYLDNA